MTMQLRITTLKDKAATTVRVEGGLDRANVSQLVAEVEAAAVPVVLDLCCLRSADSAAVHVLQELKAAGAAVEGASLYIARLLETAERDPGDES
jgi:anti-anti-sigma regulatory factor